MGYGLRFLNIYYVLEFWIPQFQKFGALLFSSIDAKQSFENVQHSVSDSVEQMNLISHFVFRLLFLRLYSFDVWYVGREVPEYNL